jgi:diacylglycerol kinase (ATP)
MQPRENIAAMEVEHPGVGEPLRDAVHGNRARQFAMPGRGGLNRIAASALNSARGLREGLFTEAAIKQEIAIAVILLPASFFVATNAWIWLALVSSVLFVLIVEFLNTSVERLCNHVTPELHEAIRVTKDLASTAVFFALCLAGLVWLVAILDRLALIG